MRGPQALEGLKLSAELRISTHDDGAVILDTRKGHVFSANAVGARVLALLQDGHSPDELTDQISAEFGAEFELVRADVQRFLAILRVNRILEG